MFMLVRSIPAFSSPRRFSSARVSLPMGSGWFLPYLAEPSPNRVSKLFKAVEPNTKTRAELFVTLDSLLSAASLVRDMKVSDTLLNTWSTLPLPR